MIRRSLLALLLVLAFVRQSAAQWVGMTATTQYNPNTNQIRWTYGSTAYQFGNLSTQNTWLQNQTINGTLTVGNGPNPSVIHGGIYDGSFAALYTTASPKITTSGRAPFDFYTGNATSFIRLQNDSISSQSGNIYMPVNVSLLSSANQFIGNLSTWPISGEFLKLAGTSIAHNSVGGSVFSLNQFGGVLYADQGLRVRNGDPKQIGLSGSGILRFSQDGYVNGALEIAAASYTPVGNYKLIAPIKNDTLAVKGDLAAYAPATGSSTYLSKSGGTMTGDLLLASATPTDPLSAAPKVYIDNLITGITWKNAVRVKTTANITLSGAQTIDGVALVAGNRVLVNNQTDQTQNGIYVVAAGAWTRPTDADSGDEIMTSTVAVTLGTLNKNTQWTCLNTTSPTIGTDAITYGQISGSGTYNASSGVDLTGNTFTLNQAFTRGLFSNGTGLGYNSSTGAFSLSDSYARGLFSASSPLSYNSSTGAFSIQQATTGQAGYLTSTDWNTFNGKQAALSGTGYLKQSGSTPSYITAIPNADLANSTISGVSLGSNLADLTATNTTVTFSGNYNGSTARTIGLNLANANTWTGLQTRSPSVTGTGAGDIVSPSITATANNQVLTGLYVNPTFANGGFTGTVNAPLRLSWDGGSTNFSISSAVAAGNVTMHASAIPSSTNYFFRSDGSSVYLNAPSGSGTMFFRIGNTNYINVFGSTGNTLLQNGGTFTDNGTDRLQVNGSIISGVAGTSTGAIKMAGATSGTKIYTIPSTVSNITETDVATLPTVNSQVKTYSTTGAASWSTIAATRLAKTANYTVAVADFGAGGELYLYVDATAGSVTITLPSAATMAPTGITYKLTVFKTDASANSVVISGGATNINGSTTYTLAARYNSVSITSDATQFYAK